MTLIGAGSLAAASISLIAMKRCFGVNLLERESRTPDEGPREGPELPHQFRTPRGRCTAAVLAGALRQARLDRCGPGHDRDTVSRSNALGESAWPNG